MTSKVQQWVCVAGILVMAVTLALWTRNLMAACNASDGSEFEIEIPVIVTATPDVVAVGDPVNFECNVTTIPSDKGGDLVITWTNGTSEKGPSSSTQMVMSVAGLQKIKADVSGDPTNGTCEASGFAEVKVIKVKFTIPVTNVPWSASGTFDAFAALSLDSYDRDNLEWTNETVEGTAATIDGSGVVTFGSGYGVYTIKAKSLDLDTCYDSMGLTVVAMESIQPASTTVCDQASVTHDGTTLPPSYSSTIQWSADGATGTGSSFIHTYSNAGDFTVTGEVGPGSSTNASVKVVKVTKVDAKAHDKDVSVSFAGCPWEFTATTSSGSDYDLVDWSPAGSGQTLSTNWASVGSNTVEAWCSPVGTHVVNTITQYNLTGMTVDLPVACIHTTVTFAVTNIPDELGDWVTWSGDLSGTGKTQTTVFASAGMKSAIATACCSGGSATGSVFIISLPEVEAAPNPIGPGEICTLTNLNGRALVWSIVEKIPNDKTLDPSDVVVSLTPVTGQSAELQADNSCVPATVVIKGADSVFPCCWVTNSIEIGCTSCAAGTCPSTTTLGCVDVSFKFGQARKGVNVGDLKLFSLYPSPVLATPAGLAFRFSDASVEIVPDTNSLPRYVIAPEYFASITISNEFCYSIDIFRRGDAYMVSNNIWTVFAGAVPVVRQIVENPKYTTNDVNTLRVVQLKDGGTEIAEYEYSPDRHEWSLAKGGGLRKEFKVEEEFPAGKIVTREVHGSGGVLVSRSRKVMNYVGELLRVAEEISGADTVAAATNRLTYFADPSQGGSYQRVAKRVEADGRWIRYEYNGAGCRFREIRPLGNQPDDTPAALAQVTEYDYSPVDPRDQGLSRVLSARTATEKVGDVVVARTWYAWFNDESGNPVQIVEHAASSSASYGDLVNARTITTSLPYLRTMAGYGRVRSVQHPDGRLDLYDYEAGTVVQGITPADLSFVSCATGACLRITLTRASSTQPNGIPGKTLREVAVENAIGQTLRQEQWLCQETDYVCLSWTVNVLDTLNRITAVHHSDGRVSQTQWGCCGKDWERDENGVKHDYFYDGLQRINQYVKVGSLTNGQADLYTTYVYDAEGRQLSQTIFAGVLSQSSSNVYDLAGQLIRSVDATGLVTEYLHDGLSDTTIRGGLTNTSISYLDGQSQCTLRNGVIQSWIEYGVNPDGTKWTKSYSGPLGTNSPAWSKTTTDLLGRTIRDERPGFDGAIIVSTSAFNSKGQLTSTTQQPNNTTTLSEYNELGEQFRSGIDVDTNGVLDLAGPDRVTESFSGYEVAGTDAVWQVRASIIYAADGAATPLTNSVQKSRLSGLGTPSEYGLLTSESVSIDLLGNQAIARSYVDREAKTTRQIVTYPDSTTPAMQVSVNGQLIASVSKTGVTTTNFYDSFGRQVGSISGGSDRYIANSSTYNSKGQVAATMDGASNTTTYIYDDLGRRIQVTDALSNSTYTAYDPEGRVLATWGATYPVAYDFDKAGRMTAMYTLRDSSLVISNYSSFITHTSSFDRTRWAYDEATGLLTNKLYADGHGPSYTYTPDGKLKTRTWARGVVTTYNYDSLGQMTNISYSDSTPAVTFAFDRLGRQATITDGAGTRTFTHNDALQLASELVVTAVPGGISNQIVYAFDNLGRSAGFTAGPNYSVSYGYSTIGRFASVSALNNQEQITNNYSYSYLPGSDLVQGYSTDSGFSAMRTFEPNRNLITSLTNSFGGTQRRRFDYTNDEIGRRTQRMDYDLSVVISNLFAYNIRSELEDAAMGTSSFSYRYDPIGNRRAATNNAEALAYAANSLNQYTNISDTSATSIPSYDLDGNMTAFKDWTFVWDAENRLILVSNATMVVSNSYDYMSRRVSKTVSSPTSSFIPHSSSFFYQGWAMIAESTATTTKSYVYGLDLSGTAQGAGTIGGILSADLNGTNAFFAYDANGNVTDLVGTNGDFLAQYQYDPYGNTISKAGVLADVNPFQFSTKYTDEETGLLYYGYRYYQPETGRWLGRDPLNEQSGSINLYCCSGNDMICLFDVLGKWVTNVHHDETLKWADMFKQIFKAEIARADEATDSGRTGPTVTIGRHLRQTKDGSDSRMWYFMDEYKNALEYISKKKCKKAAEAFGQGLHSLQDISAHRPWPTILGGGDWPATYRASWRDWHVSVHPGWWDYYASDIWTVASDSAALRWEYDRLWQDHGIVDSDYYPWVGSFWQRFSQKKAQDQVVADSKSALRKFEGDVRSSCCAKEMLVSP